MTKKGNYMVFFPSYKMMEQVCDVFLENASQIHPVKRKR